MDLTGKTVLVIGGSGALGSIFVQKLSDLGATVLATASSNESAARIPQSASQRLLLDLTKTESIKALCDWILTTEELTGIVNAAGVVGFGPAEEVDQNQSLKMNQINYLGPMEIFTALRPKLAQQDESFLINISGIVAQTPLPNMAHYSASKSGIHGFLMAATREWRRSGTKVHSSILGHTETGLANRPLFGTAPQMPQGLSPEDAVDSILKEVI